MVSGSRRLVSCWRWLLGAVLLLTGCTSFDHLTHLRQTGKAAPRPVDAGPVTSSSMPEWQASVHAKAATGAAFLEAAGDPPEADCRPQCHSPLRQRDRRVAKDSAALTGRRGSPASAAIWWSGAMHGPHGSTALVSPHPIEESRPLHQPRAVRPLPRRDPGPIGKGHRRHTAPTCRKCHQASVQRTASQGPTSFPADLLGGL